MLFLYMNMNGYNIEAGLYLYGGNTGNCPTNILRFMQMCTPISNGPVNCVPTQYLVPPYFTGKAKDE